MKKEIVLSIDCGTQSIRAMLFDKEGNLLAKAKNAFKEPYFSIKPGYAEQHVEFYWDELCKATNQVKEQYPELWEQIAAVTVTTIRASYVCVDKDYKPLRPMILWLDQRKAPINPKKDIPLLPRILFKAVGMYEAVVKQMQKGACNWIMREEPDIWAKTHKYLAYSSYMNYMLCGSTQDAVASQIGHVPLNYKKQEWYASGELNRCMFNIPTDKLSELVPSGTVIGEITEEAEKATGIKAGTKVIASGSDKACETLGVGCINDYSASLSFGTTATIQTTTSEYVEPIAFMPAYPAVVKDRYNPEVQIFRGYWMISWFKEQFAKHEESIAKEKGVSLEEILDEKLETIPPCSEGLLLQAFWTPGLKEPEGKGAIIGFSDVHKKEHIYRAIIEGIGFGLMDGLKAMEKKCKHPVDYLTVSGGGSSSDIICQITADMFGRPVKRVQTYETSGLGSAMATFLGLGVYNTVEEAVEKMVHFADTFEPNMDNHKIYAEMYDKVYSKMYKCVKPLYLAIRDIIKI